jgi:hypothetical protein
VDGGLNWAYSPTLPAIGPPVGSAGELVKLSQSTFWAVNMGKPPGHNPTHEAEYLVKASLKDAEYDNTLRSVASTYRPQDDILVTGTGADGPRVLTFAPILSDRLIPLNDVIKDLLNLCETEIGSEVEIEFAVTLTPRGGSPARFGFLQVRPMVVSHEKIEVAETELLGENLLIASDRVLGNGTSDTICDVVYVKPQGFEAKYTMRIAQELERINHRLVNERTPYLLIGFGRWGSSDSWLGTPVEWSQISGARTIVEATLPEMNVDLSQGSHFFHNLTSFQILYFMVRHDGAFKIDWTWLDRQDVVEETELVRHVRLAEPLLVKVDGRSGRGVIRK